MPVVQIEHPVRDFETWKAAFELYAELVGIHAWSPDAYEAWLAGALQWSVGELLDDPS